jgi:HPt (histidine-containing phosphotransfer) domain-containing protein
MPPPDEIEVQLAELRKGYAKQLPEKVQRIETLCEAFFTQAWEQERCATACRSAHSLAGSSGTYGFGELGKAAKTLELLIKASLERKGPPTPAELEQARMALATLKEMAAAARG